MTERTLTVSVEDAVSPEALALIRELSAELGPLYGDDGSGAFSPTDLDVPRAAFVIARLDGRAVGCGAIRPFTDDPTCVEVKRMFVSPEVRGRGISRLILRKLEALAASFGYDTLKLETGVYQTEAIGLYEKEGYRRIPCYGEYSHRSWSLCYAKDVTPANDV